MSDVEQPPWFTKSERLARYIADVLELSLPDAENFISAVEAIVDHCRGDQDVNDT